MQLAILCGGIATRLGDLSKNTPKILMDINGTPFIEILLAEYRKAGFDKFVLLTGHLGKKLKKYESNNIQIMIEKKPLGTGGAVTHALDKLDSHFWVANGDTFIKAEYVKRYIEYSKVHENSSFILGSKHAGLFSFNKDFILLFKILPESRDKQLNLEKDILSRMCDVHYYVGIGKFHDIGTPERLEEFRKFYKRGVI
jgi:NDP-sugar pyrophosphorylase family protein